MPNYMDKALSRSRSAMSLATTTALALKAQGRMDIGTMFDFSPSSGIAQVSQFQDQGANRMRYAQFRGWIHAAVHALGTEGASQTVHVGRMIGAKEKKTPKQAKAFEAEVRKDGKSYLAKAHDIKKMPEWLQAKAAANELEVFHDHPLLDILKRPNPIQHNWQIVYSFIANMCITGWGFIIGGYTDDGDLEFYSVPTTWVYPDHSKGAFAEFRIRNPKNPMNTDDEPFTRENVAFAYIPNPADPLQSLAPAQAQTSAIRIDEHIQSSQAMFFENAVFPSAIVTIGKNPHPDVPGGMRPRLTPAQRRQVYGAIRKVCAGVANYGNPAIIDGMIENIERWSATQNEIGWEKSEKSVRTRILSAFGVHPFILGEEMAGSYAQAFVVQDRFCKRVNVFLSLLSTMMTEFAPTFKVPEGKQKSLLVKAGKVIRSQDDKLMVWWENTKAVDPSMEKSLWEGARTRGDVGQNEFRAFMHLPPDEDGNEDVIDKTSIQAIAALAAQVKAGTLEPEQAQAILKGLGLPDELAEQIAGDGPSEEDLAAQQQEEEGGGFGNETKELESVVKSLESVEAVLSKTQRLIGTE